MSAEVAHVNNVEYVQWVDALAAMHAAELGHGRPAMLASGRMWFVARHELDYRAECFAGDVLHACLLYTSPSPRDLSTSRMPSSA